MATIASSNSLSLRNVIIHPSALILPCETCGKLPLHSDSWRLYPSYRQPGHWRVRSESFSKKLLDLGIIYRAAFHCLQIYFPICSAPVHNHPQFLFSMASSQIRARPFPPGRMGHIHFHIFFHNFIKIPLRHLVYTPQGVFSDTRTEAKNETAPWRCSPGVPAQQRDKFPQTKRWIAAKGGKGACR